jgi:hypothetical protein
MMIKKLLPLVALLLPGLAYAGNPTANFTINVVPAGGTTPPLPTPAQAAGFTTLAKNWDFSQPLYSNIANWADCGTSTNTTKDWHQKDWSGGVVPICDIPQVSDQGFTVIDMHWDTNRTNYPLGAHQIIRTASIDNTTAIVNFGAFYMETEFRFTPNTDPYTYFAFWSSGNPPFAASEDLEYDTVEAGNTGAGMNLHNWHGGTGGCPPNNFNCINTWFLHYPADIDTAAYHKFGMLVTNDGSSVWACGYVDGVAQGACGNMNAQSTQINNRNYMILDTIGEDLNGGCCAAVNTHMYIKYVRVWSCANWQTQLCHGVAFSTPP